jgi:hypothetical protein
MIRARISTDTFPVYEVVPSKSIGGFRSRFKSNIMTDRDPIGTADQLRAMIPKTKKINEIVT